ncbi:MAG: hypothetical protein ACO3NK_00105 [Prochlorotrichaceae cyanobacterium]|jgi:hypothetical protein
MDRLTNDPIVQKVVEQINTRSLVGIEKYGTTLDREDLSVYDWLTHLQQELMDAVNYLEVLKEKFRE